MYKTMVKRTIIYLRDLQEIQLYQIMADPKMLAAFMGTPLFYILLPLIALLYTLLMIFNGVKLAHAANKNLDHWLQFSLSFVTAAYISISFCGTIIAAVLGLTFAAGPWYYLAGVVVGLLHQLAMFSINVLRMFESPKSLQRTHYLQAAFANLYASITLTAVIGTVIFVLLTPIAPLIGTISATAAIVFVAADLAWRLCPQYWKLRFKNNVAGFMPSLTEMPALSLVESNKFELMYQYFIGSTKRNSTQTQGTKYTPLFTCINYCEETKNMDVDSARKYVGQLITNKIKALETTPASNKIKQKLALMHDLDSLLSQNKPIAKKDLSKRYPQAFQSFWVEKGEVEQIVDATVLLSRKQSENLHANFMS